MALHASQHSTGGIGSVRGGNLARNKDYTLEFAFAVQCSIRAAALTTWAAFRVAGGASCTEIDSNISQALLLIDFGF